ncbi:zinc ribbon domain-containing protein [Blautia sp. MSJ-19]|uniref:zinc ribbon domain-containing protein n=1 Tax=Blautia sp. MSJ-19 TaxID=2841517 RepID=UPI001C0F041F|nr:zinc ribbon domain-containing protein [Blautia sp. MSJ-19]MBU5481079.1 zinc ribbon domain-containing protein [Blautia sp. MSJ-19]
MAKDFFGNLGETLTKTAKELSGRAEEVYETQRLKNKIAGEERQVEKAMADLGRIIYKRYKEEIPVDDAQKAICEQIDQRMEQIGKYKEDISDLKIRSKRFCPACGSQIEKEAAFCSHCGAACPTEEPEEAAGDDVIEGTAEEVTVEDTVEETSEEAETPTEETENETPVEEAPVAETEAPAEDAPEETVEAPEAEVPAEPEEEKTEE